ncbi:AtpZ/AtpI family protein [Oscillospiraceae bacterium MB08-C2-2]|nr:AtpZ/AtpI family protein [Oscillospiraceae bacterium MB08-C2-2]
MKESEHREVLRALGLFTQLGLTMLSCVFVGVWIGRFLINRFGAGPWALLLCVALGVLASFKVLYDTVIKEWLKK